MLLFKRHIIRVLFAIFFVTSTGCVTTVVGAAVGVTVAAAKVPFKVAGAVIDVASDDEDE